MGGIRKILNMYLEVGFILIILILAGVLGIRGNENWLEKFSFIMVGMGLIYTAARNSIDSYLSEISQLQVASIPNSPLAYLEYNILKGTECKIKIDGKEGTIKIKKNEIKNEGEDWIIKVENRGNNLAKFISFYNVDSEETSIQKKNKGDIVGIEDDRKFSRQIEAKKKEVLSLDTYVAKEEKKILLINKQDDKGKQSTIGDNVRKGYDYIVLGWLFHTDFTQRNIFPQIIYLKKEEKEYVVKDFRLKYITLDYNYKFVRKVGKQYQKDNNIISDILNDKIHQDLFEKALEDYRKRMIV